MANLERAKKSRSAIRRAFTATAKRLTDLMNEENIDMDQLRAEMQVFDEKRETLCGNDQVIYDLMLDLDVADADMDTELKHADEYNLSYKSLRLRYQNILSANQLRDTSPVSSEAVSVRSEHSVRSNTEVLRRLKLPVIEFKKFGGDIREWLSFWGQFQKINDDSELSNEDKFQYLIQATLPGTRARELVDSFPPSSENYPKAIECLKARFGRDDLLIEVYVRDFLKIILNKASFTQGKSNLSSMYDRLETQLRALNSLGVTTENCSAILYPLVESCLPEELLRAWQRSTAFSENRDATRKNCLDKLMEFIRAEVENNERINLAVEGFGLHSSDARDKRVKNKPETLPTAASLINVPPKCIFCDKQHESSACFKGQKLTLAEKRKILLQKRACFNCLKGGHNSKKCFQKFRCIICDGSHMPFMCDALPIKAVEKSSVNVTKLNEKTNASEQSLSNISDPCIFMQTLKVIIRGKFLEKKARVIIDTGSQRSYILKTLAEELRYPIKRNDKIVHTLFGGSKTTEQNHECYDIRLMSLNREYACKFEALAQPIICENVTSILNGPWISELSNKGIVLTDVNGPSPIEILIGADIAGKLLTGRKHTLESALVAVETFLGWTLLGKAPVSGAQRSTTMTVASLLNKDASLSQLWQLDVLGIEDPNEKRSREEVNSAVNEHFLSTVQIDTTGRYIVKLPWKEGHPPLADNYVVAQRRLESNFNKLNSNNMLKEYERILLEWEDLDIIERVLIPVHETNRVHYLPHRAVVKSSSITCKIRPVFDASSHEKNQPSINDCLDSGPNLIEIIPSILLRFRLFEIGVIADIEKAFLQILISADERDCFRFLWRTDVGSDVIYRHKRVVFGVCCSPYLLGMTIKYHLQRMLDLGKYSQNILGKLNNTFYVDNVVASVSSNDELQKFIYESTAIMKEAHFNLRGWEHSSLDNSDVIIQNTNVLGLLWDRKEDCLFVNVESCNMDMPVTKRNVLSFVHKIFDPVGFTCPVTVIPKLLLQQAWSLNIEWDDELNDEMQIKFIKWRNELSYLSEIKIPRWVTYRPNQDSKLSIHTFCDASISSYAAVVFLRIETRDNVNVHLLGAKARVAPLKKMSVPRLELLAATIAARLHASIREVLVSSFSECYIDSYFWSDSSTVISWINREDQWTTFVWNRTKEIRQLTDKNSWRHVPGSMNPADLPSRGCSPRQLIDSRWWEGPDWLIEKNSMWPHVEPLIDEEAVSQEKRKKIITSMFSVEGDLWYNVRFARYSRIVNLITWLLRFVWNCRNPTTRIAGQILSADELDRGEKTLIKIIQAESYSDVRTKELMSLCPFTDADGIIRLRTKVSYRDDLNDFRYPMLLPPRHPVVQKLIFDTHENHCHAGTQTVQNILREHYWIVGGRRSVKTVISSCVRCKRYDSRKMEETPPPLPLDRVRDAHIFEVIGIDIAGPLHLKDSRKIWVCVFTCAVFRAVHFEAVSSLSTDNFLLAFRRFIARRGRPRVVFTDNGTNFVGSENAMFKLDWDIITRNSSVPRIIWRFNPPTAAWWGGFWERMVGLLKQLLRKVLGKASLSYEELSTVLCDCEAIINARPITYDASNPNELCALTPNMFLQELREFGVPDLDHVNQDTLQKRVIYRNKLREDLRRRFRSEYLGQLKLMSTRSSRPIMLGEFVLVGNDQSKRIDWPLAIVEELIPGKDGKVRLVRLRTTTGQLLRPIQRLYPLECSVSTGVEKTPPTTADIDVETTPEKSNVSVREDVRDVESSEICDVPRVNRKGRVLKIPERLLL